ncbi:MAG TPA: hypothetical protein VFW87_09130 [Pirellulales bacterium]|nr:hypothetical protein [Pirellulales bacterium]
MNGPAINAAEAYSLLAADPPQQLRVAGALDYSAQSERLPPPRFPETLEVDVLDLSGQDVTELPAVLTCYELNLSRTPIRALPEHLWVESRLDLTGCDRLERLPEGIATGALVLRGCTALRALPERLDVWFLDLTGCWAFDTWPQKATIRGGRLALRGCTALSALPTYLGRLAALDVRDCPNLTSLPANLAVTGWLDLGRSGLTNEWTLPPGVARTQLRWAGVNIDRRIAFHPESMHVDEVLHERNAERRRAMLDRYGYARFLQDAHAEILDRDVDPGGPRQLLRVRLEDDEDLVALACNCPSTARQYMIRVPPSTPSCRHAAAWIAGFDNPDDYRPVVET